MTARKIFYFQLNETICLDGSGELLLYLPLLLGLNLSSCYTYNFIPSIPLLVYIYLSWSLCSRIHFLADRNE